MKIQNEAHHRILHMIQMSEKAGAALLLECHFFQ